MAAPIPPHFSIDFGNNTLKLVYITKKGNSWELKSFGAVQTPQGALNSYKEEQKLQMIEAIKSLVADARVPVNEVAVSLPEGTVFSRVITLPTVKDEEIQDAIYWQLKQLLPYPIEEVQSDFTVLETNEKGEKKILAVAAPKKLVSLYVELLEKAGLNPVAIESETLSIMRSVKYSHSLEDAVLLDFGAQSTDMAVILGGELYFSQSISTGSDLLTKAIATEFQLSYPQAEEYKRAYGLIETAAEGKIYRVLKPVIDIIGTEILRGLTFYKTQIGRQPPSTVVISGEAALLPGLQDFLKNTMNSEIVMANPWNDISMSANMKDTVTKTAPGFCVSVGLCLKTE